MVFTPSRGAAGSGAFREFLEASYRKRTLVHLEGPFQGRGRGLTRAGTETCHFYRLGLTKGL